MTSVVHIVQRMSPGGIEALALELVRALPGQHHLVSLEGDKDALIAAWPRLSQIERQFSALGKPPGKSLSCLRRLARLLRARRAESIITHHIGPLLYGSIARRWAGTPRAIHVEHDSWHLRARKRRVIFNTLVFCARPDLVGVSQGIADKVSHMTRRSVRVITNGVDASRFSGCRALSRRRLGLCESDLVIGAVGRLEAVKGHDILLSAFQLMRSPARLVIVGDGSRRAALEAQAQALGLSERVIFLGAVESPEAVYPAFDVFCLPSRNEGLPLAVLEAQAAGAPVVAANVGDVASAVCPQSGWLVPPEDPMALACALDDALSQPVRSAPQKFVSANFDWSATVRGYAELLRCEQ